MSSAPIPSLPSIIYDYTPGQTSRTFETFPRVSLSCVVINCPCCTLAILKKFHQAYLRPIWCDACKCRRDIRLVQIRFRSYRSSCWCRTLSMTDSLGHSFTFLMKWRMWSARYARFCNCLDFRSVRLCDQVYSRISRWVNSVMSAENREVGFNIESYERDGLQNNEICECRILSARFMIQLYFPLRLLVSCFTIIMFTSYSANVHRRSPPQLIRIDHSPKNEFALKFAPCHLRCGVWFVNSCAYRFNACAAWLL